MYEKLKIALYRKNITQRQLACALGVSDAHISRIIRGQSRCRARHRRVIAQFLGVREHELFPHRRARKRNSCISQTIGESSKKQLGVNLKESTSQAER